jgi:hypothetical protein
MATEDPELCIDLSVECIEGSIVGGTIPIRGVVTNCGDVPLPHVAVRDQDSGTYYLDWIPLGPGESAVWEGEVEYDSDECPLELKLKALGWTDGWVSRATAYVTEYCECPTVFETCRTPGFWGTRAGTEKRNSRNITQMVIDAAPSGLMVCGEPVDNTMLEYYGSAQEAMCVSIEGEQNLQLARQLTAAALNCVVSGSPWDCEGTSIAGLFDDCNDVCMAGTDPEAINYCYTRVDCWNNGGTMLDSGMCQMGNCAVSGAPCEETEDCGYTLEGTPEECVMWTDTCHYQPLVNEDLGLDFSSPGPAGSSNACNAAIGNDCDLFDGCDN